MGQWKLYMGQESLIGWDRRKQFDGTGEVDITSKQDNFLALNVLFLLVGRRLLPEL
jgi:hypothetical protein